MGELHTDTVIYILIISITFSDNSKHILISSNYYEKIYTSRKPCPQNCKHSIGGFHLQHHLKPIAYIWNK